VAINIMNWIILFFSFN